MLRNRWKQNNMTRGGYTGWTKGWHHLLHLSNPQAEVSFISFLILVSVTIFPVVPNISSLLFLQKRPGATKIQTTDRKLKTTSSWLFYRQFSFCSLIFLLRRRCLLYSLQWYLFSQVPFLFSGKFPFSSSGRMSQLRCSWSQKWNLKADEKKTLYPREEGTGRLEFLVFLVKSPGDESARQTPERMFHQPTSGITFLKNSSLTHPSFAGEKKGYQDTNHKQGSKSNNKTAKRNTWLTFAGKIQPRNNIPCVSFWNRYRRKIFAQINHCLTPSAVNVKEEKWKPTRGAFWKQNGYLLLMCFEGIYAMGLKWIDEKHLWKQKGLWLTRQAEWST